MRVTVITGCSTGIGLVTARHLARKGDRVYATARNPAGSAALQEVAAAEPSIRTLPLDVTSDESVGRAIETILEREGHIDALVNNAGIGTFGTFEFAPESELRATFETNFWGVIRVTRAVLPSMRARSSGVIVNISSVAGRLAGPAMGVYPASKYALEAASEALAREVYPLGIRVAIVIDSNASKLRYPAGADAAVMMSARARTSDEDWIALGRPMSDEEYFVEMGKLFGGG